MNNNLRVALTTFAFGAIASFSVAAQDTISIEHAQGTTEVPLNPIKIVTYDLASLDVLDALGIDVFGVPAFLMPANLKAYEGEEYAKLGSLFEPDYEAVNAAEPDLIIVAGRSASAYAELSNIAPTIDLTNDWENFIPSIKANSEILGQIFERSDTISAWKAELDNAIAEVQAQADDIGRVFLVMTNGGKVTAYGPGSRLGFLHDTLGMEPAIADVEAATHGESISYEFLLETNPDWLVVLDRDAAIGSESGASAAQTLDNELVARTSAWTNDQVVYVDAARWYITNGGLTNMIAIVEELSSAMGAQD